MLPILVEAPSFFYGYKEGNPGAHPGAHQERGLAVFSMRVLHDEGCNCRCTRRHARRSSRPSRKHGRVEIVGEAVDGAGTLALAKTTDATLLTLGLAMPGVHGIELIPLIKLENPLLRILVATRYPEQAHAMLVCAGQSSFKIRRCDAVILKSPRSQPGLTVCRALSRSGSICDLQALD
ncbi:hypothetical protein [Paraburkholderia bryophila]|uniref:CheY-like chemotaxis protein n=1 Tax=Paraburkholderia bryophila TaxID=420952 RepID=A0A7Y9WFN5_9BURK|nr:hypothetical protein [Paraburkholderia bryophila]NYH19961.1 CheY-like chemotaxis protein [Paraburkholderia bryophila]